MGHAFYCYLVEIDTKKFNALVLPVTKAKQDLCAELTTPLEKFLKFEHLKEHTIKRKSKNVFRRLWNTLRY